MEGDTGRKGGEGKKKKQQQKQRGEERQKVMLNQFYLRLLFTDPIETTIFGFLISRAKPFG